jgi:hypothetical protein
VRDDSSGRDRPDALGNALNRIFSAALDLRAELPHVEDPRAAAHIHATIALLDDATRELSLGALDRRPGDRLASEVASQMSVAFYDEEP